MMNDFRFCFHSLLLLGTACSDPTLTRISATEPADTSVSADTESSTDTDTVDSDTSMQAHEVFEQLELLEYHVTMDDADRERLEEHGDEEVFLPASVTINGGNIDQGFPEVGFRHKGSYSLMHCYESGSRNYEDECAKISYKLKFDEVDPDARFFGLKKINLHAMSSDDTKLRERLAYDMFNSFGVDAPRTAYAKLFINEDLMGLFVQVEEIDGRYTAHHFPSDGDGNLYKEVWPKANYPDSHFLDHLETNNNPEDNPNVSDMQDFGAAVDGCTEETFPSAMEAWVDIDTLLRYMAVDRASKNWDGIVTFYDPSTSHNFYWYHDAKQGGIFHLIPWDLDNTFWEFDPYMHPEQWVTADPVPDWNVKPASCDPVPLWEPTGDTTATPPGCDKLINLLASTSWDRFKEFGDALLEGPLQMSVMEDKLATWEAEIDDAAAEDPYLDYTSWRDAADGFRSILDRAIDDFTLHLQEGYRVQEPVVTIPEPSDEELLATIPESGLLVDVINNYEFEGGAASSAPKDVSCSSNDTTIIDASWNTKNPIFGTADLRLDFEITRTPGAWDEWLEVHAATDDSQKFDLTGFTLISLTMKSDVTRTVRVMVDSPVYYESFGNAWPNFMMEFQVGPTAQIFKVKLDKLYYPSWAKDAWGDGDGWTSSDEEALEQVLERFDGLIIQPVPNQDSAGELVDEVETGYLQVDNIYFR
jgi:hypothetical protein